MSFVATMSTDTRTFSDPTWADVEREIGALNARIQTIVTLSPPPPRGAPEGDCHLAVGGGDGGRFIVYVTDDNLTFWNLADPERRGAERRVRMNIGGQEGEYREAQFVSLDLAMRAARQYVEDGRRAPDLTWIEERG